MNKEILDKIIEEGYIITKDDVFSPTGGKLKGHMIRLYVKGSSTEGKIKFLSAPKAYLIWYYFNKTIIKLGYKDGSCSTYKLDNLKPFEPKPRKKYPRKKVEIKKEKPLSKNYLEDTDLMYNIIISKGKGYMTPELEKMLIDISYNLVRKFIYKDPTYYYDCRQDAILSLIKEWKGFDIDKYDKALPYFTEIAKRAISRQFNELNGYKNGNLNNGKIYTISINNYYY